MPPFAHIPRTPVPNRHRGVRVAALSLIPLAAGACSSDSGVAGPNAVPDSHAQTSAPTPAPPAASAAESGLEVTTFISALDNRSFAAALAPYADQPLPISREMGDLWDAHGLRMISLPLEDAPALMARLQTASSGGVGGSQNQWLGQAYSWTEAARAQEFPPRIVALDTERIRLNAGVLRLLVRSWLEPIPPPPQPSVGAVIGSSVGIEEASAPSALLRVELVPQNRETTSPDTLRDPTAPPPSIDAETQGQLFTRLYAKMTMTPGRALLILPEHPGVVWRTLAEQPVPPPQPAATTPEPQPAPRATSSSNSEDSWPKRADATPAAPPPESHPIPAALPRTGTPPKVGEVVRVGAVPTRTHATASESQDPSDSAAGPSGPRVPTLGEALLVTAGARMNDRTRTPPQRTMILLVPHLPKDFHLLGPAPGATSQRDAGSPSPR